MIDSSADGGVVAPGPAVIEQNTSVVVARIAAALAEHCEGGARIVSTGPDTEVLEFDCGCGWKSRRPWANGSPYPAHVASVVAALPDIAIVPIPTEQMTDRSYVADSIQDRPMWLVGDSWACIADDGVEFETDSQNAYGTIPVDGIGDLTAVLLAAARAAGGQA